MDFPENFSRDRKAEIALIRFIGFYDYTVILTYLSLASTIFGMTQAIHGDYKLAVFCLAFSGFCDAFDGRVARTKKNRTEDEKNFGIQLDSLCDVVCFGIFPAMICYLLGVRGVLGVAILIFYCLCAVIRLAFFNVLEAKRQSVEGGSTKVYRGLPVTSMGMILPLIFLLQFVLPDMAFLVVLHIIPALVGFLFILDFPIKKPGPKGIFTMMGIVMVAVMLILCYTRFRLPAHDDRSNAIVDGIIGEIYEAENP